MVEGATNELARIMSAAVRNAIAIPAFNIPYLPMLEPVAASLLEHDAFALIEVARLEFTKFEAKSPAAVAEEFGRHADSRVTRLHLDHVPVIDEDGMRVDWKMVISEALELGYDSVMIDGSRLALEENIAVTAEVVGMAHAAGALAEAELGSVLGHESGPMPPYEELFARRAGFTRVDEARRFVEETGVDWLSVSVGSVHGAISPAAKNQDKVCARLDIEHLRRIHDVTGIPLVLHGGSGIQHSYIEKAIRSGIAKINIGTDIRQPYERTLAETGRFTDAQAAVADKIKFLICDVYRIEGSASQLHALKGSV
ncbi:MAG: class II fructose-bisphosphate aldolase [Armatimonadetes bacterium]|nr:class II fructose-bisphosphate aldolase [Armatimonadota bacterium]